jgi:hypothetical protein
VRVSYLGIRLTASDLNESIAEFAPSIQLRINEIREDGMHGQLKFLLWNIDFVAQPSSLQDGSTIFVDVSAHKLIPIPSSLVQYQLKEAMKDAPPGIDVLRQTIKVHLPSILKPFNASLRVREFQCHQGYVSIVFEDCRVSDVRRFFEPR